MTDRMSDDDPLFPEIYGYKPDATTDEAKAAREESWWDVSTGERWAAECPFKGGACNKSTTTDDDYVDGTRATGVCSLNEGNYSYIVCPERFRTTDVFQGIVDHVFDDHPHASWAKFSEERIPTTADKIAGNVDHVVALHSDGELIDFVGIEVQATYFSGDAYRPEFYEYMEQIDDGGDPQYIPTGTRRPDFRSCGDKRLIPQVRQKGDIFNSWGRDFAVILDTALWDYLPSMPEPEDGEPDFYFFVYRLDDNGDHYNLVLDTVKETTFTQVVQRFEMDDEGRPSESQYKENLREKIQEKITTQTATDEWTDD